MKKLIILLLFSTICFSQQIVRLNKMENNLYEINVELNNTVKLPFLFDTGASEMLVSPSVVRILILNKTLSVKDTLQGRYCVYANGEVAYHKRFMIKKLKMGKVILRNVTCSVSNTENTSLLLGQSALKKFKNYKVDNVKNTLTVTK